MLVRRRSVLQAGLALCASLIARPSSACEYFSPTLRITHPWTRATPPDATSAVVCMKFDLVNQTDRLVGVETPVAAGAEFVGDFLIREGAEMELSEAGAHVRLTGLNQPLFVGRSYPLELSFEKGGVVSAKLNVDFVGLLLPFRRPVTPEVSR